MSRRRRAEARSGAADSGFPFARFVVRALVWALPVAVLWVLVTPFYNLFLVRAADNLIGLAESQDVTRLVLWERNWALIQRSDLQGPGRGGSVGQLRVTDVHFPLLLVGAAFLAVPGVSLARRGEALGWALLVLAFLHLATVVFGVRFVYATQLGAWSLEHYGPLARNFWGLGKHLLDLPFKFAAPVALWAWFFLPRLLPAAECSGS